jgi:hypothetical protein
MEAKDLPDRLRDEPVVDLSAEDWAAVAADFEEIERHDTGIAGDLILIRTPAGPAAVERPSPGRRVVRVFPDEDAMRRFVAERLELYERMWDGCGCKIDYYA